ncbi:MAG: HDIG domain-containing protein [Clostridia bacterium]|nr:HDIG domain-containing protein [Clostridia bacterium]
MTKTKLSNKEIVLSILTFIICQILLFVVLFLMLVINTGSCVIPFILDNINNVITVAIASVILSFIVYIYFFIESKDMLAHCGKIIEVYLILYISLLATDVIGFYVDAAARPLLFFPLITAMLFKRRKAIFLTFIYSLQIFIFNRFLNGESITSFVSIPGTYQPIHVIEGFSGLLVMFCSGVLGIFLLRGIKTRMGTVMVALVLFIPTVIINIVIQLSNYVGANLELMKILELAVFSLLDCIFSVLLFELILPIMEVLFSELTQFRLRELTSDNAKLIKKLKQQALGTYNHCVVVAQLAEACASAINEDPELARAAAYYHDIGKLKNPEMFAENQSEYDLHKELTPELSVDIIRSHAREGAKLIKKYKLPDFFADIAVQHHGTLPIKYFYAKALKMSDGELNVSNYSYPGPTPTSKIAAIIMIADASEAAVRSLSNRSAENVAKLVGSIVEERMNLDQFVDCNITLSEINIVTQTVINQLAGVYHARVKYPKLVLSKNK